MVWLPSSSNEHLKVFFFSLTLTFPPLLSLSLSLLFSLLSLLGSGHVIQAVLEFLGSSDPPVSASLVVGTI